MWKHITKMEKRMDFVQSGDGITGKNTWRHISKTGIYMVPIKIGVQMGFKQM
jgi:hypothetical protein